MTRITRIFISRVILLKILLVQCCVVDNIRVLAFSLTTLPHHEHKISKIAINRKTSLSVTSTVKSTDLSIKSSDISKQSADSKERRIQQRARSKVQIAVSKANSPAPLPTNTESTSSTPNRSKLPKKSKNNPSKRRPKKNDRMIELDGPLKPVRDLVLGSEISGFVASFTSFGAFVKISYDIKGKKTAGFALLHKSQFMDEQVDDMKDHLKIGQHLKKLRVINIDYDKGQVGVSMRKKRGNRMDFSEVMVGSEVVGKVTTVMSYGAFVDIGCKKNVLLHISRISQRKIDNIRHYVKEGDVVKIRIADKDEKKKSLAGSMLSYSAERYVKKREKVKAKAKARSGNSKSDNTSPNHS